MAAQSRGGDEVTENQDIITLESDKAAMEIPSSAAGKVAELLVSVGDKVKEGDVILKLESAADAPSEKPAKQPAAAAKTEAQMETIVTELRQKSWNRFYKLADSWILPVYEMAPDFCLTLVAGYNGQKLK